MLRIFNTLTKEKEVFTPVQGKAVTMYVCGPTVYDYSHMGHAKTYVHFDVIARYLRYCGYSVTYVQNITDVGHLEYDRDEGEDKVVKRAKTEQIHPMELVERYTRSYFEDMDRLNVVRPNISPRASAHIPEIIDFIERLIACGVAYQIDGSVYFDTRQFPSYGALSGRRTEAGKAGTRVAIRTEKRHVADFSLWKRADDFHILQWKSPWGWGYPGWHIECSVMSVKYLGETIDIHGGAVELVFPHHENEVAQSEAYSGKQFVRYWVHGGVLLVDGQKMSKSSGNFLTIRKMLEKYSAETIRYFLVSRHYRQSIDFREELVSEAEKALAKIQEVLRRLASVRGQNDKNHDSPIILSEFLAEYRLLFANAMDDDFNTPLAMSYILDMTKELNKLLDRGDISGGHACEILSLYEEFGSVLGLFECIPRSPAVLGDGAIDLPAKIAVMIGEREKARQDKRWNDSDCLRMQIFDEGWLVEDTKEGLRLRRR